MKNIIIIPFLTLYYCAFGQQYVDSTIIKDFNDDGVLDTLNYFREYGSGAGGTDYKIINGKTNEVFELSNYSSYGDTKKLIILPRALSRKENYGFLETFKEGLLPTKRDIPDASLQWIIDATYTSQQLNDGSCFDTLFTPGTAWSTNTFEPPSSYYIPVQGDSLLRLSDGYSRTEIDSINTENNKGFLMYFGNIVRDGELFVDHEGDSQGVIKPTLTNKTYKIFKTEHAILAKKGNAYKWLFVTDSDITGAPQKLRWTSIGKMILKDGHLIFKQNLGTDPEYNVYIIDIESGNCGRLKVDFDEILDNNVYVSELNEEEALSIQGNTVRIGRGDGSLHISFEEIKQRLAGFSESK